MSTSTMVAPAARARNLISASCVERTSTLAALSRRVSTRPFEEEKLTREGRSPGNEIPSRPGERIDPACAVAERLHVHAERVQERQIEVGDRCAFRMPDVAAARNPRLQPAADRDQQVVVEVRVALADSAPVEKQRSVPLC